jgi:signal transduction histidine kinase
MSGTQQTSSSSSSSSYEYSAGWTVSEVHYSHLVEQNADGILIVSVEGLIRFANPAAELLLGRSRQQLNGESFGYPLVNGDKVEIELWRQRSSYVVAEMRVTQVEWVGEVSLMASLRDVTERKQAERLLNLQRDLARLFSSGGDLVQTLDDVLKMMLDRAEVDACGIYLADKQNGALYLQVHHGLSAEFVEQVRYYGAESPETHLIAQGCPIYSDQTPIAMLDSPLYQGEGLRALAVLPVQYQGQLVALLTVASHSVSHFMDITRAMVETVATEIGSFIARATAEQSLRQKNVELQQLHLDLQQKMQMLQEAQARLVQSEKALAISHLVGGLAHELNNPLASIVLRSQLLQQACLGQQSQLDLVEIVAQAQRMSRIVQRLLQAARPSSPERNLIAVNTAVHEALAFLAYELRTHQINRVLTLASNLPLVEADSYQVEQALINLFANAIDAMYRANGRGTLTVTTETGLSLYVADSANRPEVVRLRIEDDGPGISVTMQARIFDPFFTTRPPGEGMGLGLSICHNLISAQNGYLWVHSQPGKGAVFFVELPIETAVPTERDKSFLAGTLEQT